MRTPPLRSLRFPFVKCAVDCASASCAFSSAETRRKPVKTRGFDPLIPLIGCLGMCLNVNYFCRKQPQKVGRARCAESWFASKNLSGEQVIVFVLTSAGSESRPTPELSRAPKGLAIMDFESSDTLKFAHCSYHLDLHVRVIPYPALVVQRGCSIEVPSSSCLIWPET